MRKSHTKPVQLDLFGLPQDSNPIVTPKWQSLPIPARHKITGLMARLLMEHDTSHQAKDVDDPLQNRESGDV
jgi:hypothetical protein